MPRGRKGFYDEQMVKKIVDSSNRVIYHTLNKMGRFKDTPDEVIIEIAARFALKAMPQKIEGEGFAPQIITIVRSDGSKTEGIPGRLSIHRSTLSSNGFSVGNGKEPVRDSKGT